MILYLLVVGLLATASAEKARFDNYRVHSVVPQTEHHLKFLRELEASSNGLTFWNDVRHINSSVHIMVPPHLTAYFNELTEFVGLQHEVYISNVQKLIDEEDDVPNGRSSGFGWTAYYRLDEIYNWLESLAVQYPGIVSVEVGGSTYQGRQIKGVKVIYEKDNPIVFIEAGIHAREWITPATVTYLLNEVLTNQDPVNRKLFESYNWYVFPVFNPDGYEYTHTSNRMWRKTRSPSSNGCYGADPNRNWDFHWMDGGASTNPCSDTYAGGSEFSEIETKSLSEYISTIGNKIGVFLGFHSYSQLLLFPYGFTSMEVSNKATLERIGDLARIEIAKRYGTKYVVGSIVEAIYVASGSSMDWVRGEFGTPITYTYELRDTGRYGFLLPASQIIPTAEETFDSFIVILREAAALARRQ